MAAIASTNIGLINRRMESGMMDSMRDRGLRCRRPKIAVCLVGLILLSWTAILGAGRAMADAGFDFATLERRSKPNSFLVCPEGHCSGTAPDQMSPEFALGPNTLFERVRLVLENEPRLEVTIVDGRRLRAVQKSSLFGFPDDIDIEVIPSGESRSSVAIYSRARYGYYDLGVNRRRIERWLKRLADAGS